MTRVALCLLLASIGVSADRNEKTVKMPPSSWITAKVQEIRELPAKMASRPAQNTENLRTIAEKMRAQGLSSDDLFNRRLYVLDNGTIFQDLEKQTNRKAFLHPCMEVGETVQYRTQEWRTNPAISGKSQPLSITIIFVDFKPTKKNCAGLQQLPQH